MTTISASLATSASTGTDHHCGVFNVVAAITVVEDKQMVVFDYIIIDGILNVDGIFILEV